MRDQTPTQPGRPALRFSTQQHRFYCGVDLHARTMHLCVLDHQGTVALDRALPCRPEAFLHAIAPFRAGLVVGVECLFAWYWLADLCVEHDTQVSRRDGSAAARGG